MHDGTNTLAVTVTNFGLPGSTPQSNPAGLLYQLGIMGATCSTPTSTPPTPQADVSLAETVNNASPQTGATVNYALMVNALGPTTSTGVTATDILPTGLTFISASSSLGSYDSGTGIWTIGNMTPSSTATLRIAATVAAFAGTQITNTATVIESSSSADLYPGNNTASTMITVSPGGAGSCSLVSDATNLVDGNPAALVATPYNPGWTASIPGATWIWATPTDDNPTINESFTFTKTFIISGTPTAATLGINADNSYDVLLNGTDIGSNSGEANYTSGAEGNFNALGALHDGTNTLAVTVTNFGLPGSTPQSNPAGLLYQLGIMGATCSTPTSTPPGPGAIKFVFANVTSSAVVGNNAMFNILAVNSSGTIDASFEQGVTLAVSGSGGGGGLVTIVNGVGTTTVNDNIAQTVALSLQDSQSTSLDISATAHVTFTPGPVTQFVLNHPGNMNEGARLGYTVSREDQFGNFVSASGTIAYLYSSSPSANAAFFNAPSGGAQITSVLIPNGSTSTVFWYYDDMSGSRTVTASDNPVASDGAAGIIDASDTFSVAPGAVKFIFANVPSSEIAGTSATVNVYAVDSLNNIDPTYGSGVTVTMSGSASGGGLVNLVNGVGTTTIADATAETVTLGLLDTQSTGLGVGATSQIVFNAAAVPVTPVPPTIGSGPVGVPFGVKPGVTITFSGMAYPGATVQVIRKDLGLQAEPVTQAVSAAADGSFLVELDNVVRLTGQTYLLSFVDKNGLIAQTKAYNIPVQDKIVYGNILAAPTLGFQKASVVAKGAPLDVTGYATPKATVELFIDGNAAGTVLVNDPTGKYTYPLNTEALGSGRHSVWAIQKYAESAAEVAGYTNSLSEDEIFINDATNGTLVVKNASSGLYAFVPAITGGTGGGILPVVVGQMYVKQAESDFSNQQSFTISPLADPQLDLNGDGVIDIKDLSIFLSYIKNLSADVTNFHVTDPTIVKALDFNGDGAVDGSDLKILTQCNFASVMVR